MHQLSKITMPAQKEKVLVIIVAQLIKSTSELGVVRTNERKRKVMLRIEMLYHTVTIEQPLLY